MRPPSFVTVVVLCCLLVTLAPSASADPRIWVSGVGDDTNPGTRVAPRKTFAGAFAVTDPDGEIDPLDSGGFGIVTLTQGVTIDGGGGKLGSILFTNSTGVTVNAPSTATVILRRLSLQGGGTGVNGIRFLGGKTLVIQDCDISGFTTNGIDINPTTPNARVVVSNTFISTGATGVKISGANVANVSLDNVQISNTANAIDLLAGTADVSNSVITQNSGVGLFAEGGTMSSINNVVNGNGQDVRFTGGVVNTFNNAGPVGISLTQDSTTQTVSAGQSATYNLTVAPPPGGFTGAVSFATVGLPSGLTASFTPATLPAGTGTTPVKMTIAPVQSGATAPALPDIPLPYGLCLAALLGLLSVRSGGTGRLRPRFAALLPFAAALVLLATVRSASAAPLTGTWSFTATVSSGASTVSQLFTVIIQ